ncbi:hypothetical protein [Streptomyces sp. NBC_00519]|uniref:hypothetical protein n=1 Tax=Streptomyces sp. NBC_00519 TaxID=2975764 RepID=UPI0030E35D99
MTLHRTQQKQQRIINDLSAEVTAQKIAALTRQPVAGSFPQRQDLPQEPPARRKRHLALYIGGGVAAFLASVGERFRSLIRGRRSMAVTVAAGSAALVATTATALYMNTGGEAAPTAGAPLPSATSPHGYATGPSPRPKSDAPTSDRANRKDGAQGSGNAGGPANLPMAFMSGVGDVTAGKLPIAQGPAGSSSHGPDATPPAGKQSAPESPAPVPQSPTPSPSEPPPSSEPSDGSRCLDRLPVLHLCLGK